MRLLLAACLCGLAPWALAQPNPSEPDDGRPKIFYLYVGVGGYSSPGARHTTVTFEGFNSNDIGYLDPVPMLKGSGTGTLVGIRASIPVTNRLSAEVAAQTTTPTGFNNVPSLGLTYADVGVKVSAFGRQSGPLGSDLHLIGGGGFQRLQDGSVFDLGDGGRIDARRPDGTTDPFPSWLPHVYGGIGAETRLTHRVQVRVDARLRASYGEGTLLVRAAEISGGIGFRL